MLIMESKRKVLVRYRNGHKIRAISRELNLSRNTVKNIIHSKDITTTTSYIRVVQPSPKLGQYIERLEKLLRDNKNARPPRTGRAFFEELKDFGYTGSYSAVSRYIGRWKQKSSLVNINACVPL